MINASYLFENNENKKFIIFFYLLQLLVTIHYHKVLRLCLVIRIFEENVKGGKPKTKIKVKEKFKN